jgi:uncharacterized protein (DUF1330 family)
MSAYIIAQISIHDRARYDRYVTRFMPVLQRHGGRLLVADESPEVSEGRWDRDKLIVLAFPDRAAAQAWTESADYREIATDRIAATDGVVLIAQGLPG